MKQMSLKTLMSLTIMKVTMRKVIWRIHKDNSNNNGRRVMELMKIKLIVRKDRKTNLLIIIRLTF